MATKIKETKDKLELSSANMDRAASELENMDYDVFKQGAGYEGLKKNYEQQGRVAMQDTIGQVAARTGGMASSYAQTAGQQSYNNYMKTLEDAARSMFEADRQQKMNEFSIASSIYDRDNDAYRDAVADQRYDTEWDYQKERDALADQRYNTEWDYKIGQEEKSADEERIYTDIYYGGTSDYNAYKDKGGKLTQAEYESIVRSAQGARSDDTYSRDQAAKEQAQADVMAIWASGGTPTPEQLKAAGWADETETETETVSEDNGTLAGVSNLGEAYYKQATAVPEETPVFREVSAEEFGYYSDLMNQIADVDEAVALAEQILAATGNEDFAWSLLEQWEATHSPDLPPLLHGNDRNLMLR